ncbi:MAG: hypothetical protein LAO51_16580, partial [Acidobacteriia bacterium]|nr:hypothetical protein [Terriglobia bacterium]
MRNGRIFTSLLAVCLAVLSSAVAPIVMMPGARAAVGVCDQGNLVDVEATGGGGGGYATLGAAFAAINAGTFTGTINVEICGNTAEGTATATLNASGSGSASYTSITIKPVGGVARTISGGTTAGSPMIDLNGADNVTIDGVNSGGDALTISNTTASATTGTSTIRFINGATLNTVTNATVLGSFSAAVGTNGGTIYFATDASTTNGNDNNTISYCNLGPAGSNLPTKAVYINGTTTSSSYYNSGIVINGNNIYDYFGAAVTSAGVYIAGGSTDDNVTNNRFYQTATRTQTTGAQHSAIWITNSSGNNYLVSGNTIGYASGAGTGTYGFVAVSSSSVLIPIYLSVGTTTATSVQGNTIAGIAMSGAGAGTSSSGAFRGIYISSGLTTVGDVTGNTIGSPSATGSLTFTSSSSSAADVMGIYNFGTSAWTVKNNTIGGITAGNSSTGAANVYGIRVNTSTSVTFTCQSNTVGGSVANSIQTSSTATGTIVHGIDDVSPAATITGNTVRNLTAAGGTGTGSGASVVGIYVSASSTNHTVSQNTIYALANSNASAAVTVTGIVYSSSSGTNLIARNLIHTLTTPSSSATATINGIYVVGGTATYQNNMIDLGNGLANGIVINGINETTAGTDNFHFNSVYVGGTAVGGTANTFAFQSSITTNTRNYRDNIFVNARSNGAGTGKHYAIRVGGTTANPTGLTSNSNVLYASGTGGTTGLFNAIDQATLAAWQTATGQDAASFASDPKFADPTGIVAIDLHINPALTTVVEGNGVAIGTVTDDYDGDARASFTPTDIGADAGNFTGIDLSGPAISYTPPGNTTDTASRTLAATVTDFSGVPTTGIGLPVIYFRKGTSGAFTGTQCSYVSGSSYSCLMDYALVGGVVAGDRIQYYVAAQDNVGNVSVNPSAGAAGFTASPPAASTPPSSPSSYLIAGAYSGTKTVCASGCDFDSLTNTGGLFD